MPVRVDEAGFEECSRVAGVAVAAYTLRAAERWRANVADIESAMIMIAVIAIGAGRLLRADLPERYPEPRGAARAGDDRARSTSPASPMPPGSTGRRRGARSTS